MSRGMITAGRGHRPPNTFSREGYEQLSKKVLGWVSAPKAELMFTHMNGLGAKFVRGDMHMGSDFLMESATITVDFNGRSGSATTGQVDDAGLQAAIKEAETLAHEHRGPPNSPEMLGPQQYPTPPKTFFESMQALLDWDAQSGLCRQALDAADGAGVVAAGELGAWSISNLIMNTSGLFGYSRSTGSQFSMTARTKDGTGSGWGWAGHADWDRVDTKGTVARAIDLARRSAKPVAVEPGRYTVILEPPAVAVLITNIWDQFSARAADAGNSVFSKQPRGTNKLGLQMMDSRLDLVYDPWDPRMPESVVYGDGQPLNKITWFKDGVLRTLVFDRDDPRAGGQPPIVNPYHGSILYHGETSSLEEMIATTKRGIWVNRLSGVTPMNGQTMLLSGTTRDGTFLIENGKITKPIKNLRFTESPFFVFNKLEAGGESVRAIFNTIAPRLKVRDFDFTSLTDAV